MSKPLYIASLCIAFIACDQLTAQNTPALQLNAPGAPVQLIEEDAAVFTNSIPVTGDKSSVKLASAASNMPINEDNALVDMVLEQAKSLTEKESTSVLHFFQSFFFSEA